MEDRIRAEKPKKEPDSWSKSIIESYGTENGRVVVRFDNNDEVTISKAIFELFTSRLEGENVEDSEAWYKIKGS